MQADLSGAPTWMMLQTAAVEPQAPTAGESSGMRDTVESKKHAHTPRGTESRWGALCLCRCSGQRCRETRFLELHHKHAHALGGDESAGNLTLWCQAHNALAAEGDFGRAFILRQQVEAAQRKR